MANNIALAKKYVDLLDEVYRVNALTSILDSDMSLSRAGANTNEIVIPKISMDGLADYSRNSGYVSGDVALSWETVKFNYERGRMFTVDVMDDEETQNVAFGRLAGEVMRIRVVPEIEAFRLGEDVGTAGISTAAGADLADGLAGLSAITAGMSKMDEDEVPQEGRILFITPTLARMVEALDTNKSREVLAGFSQIIRVPQSRFYTAIDLYDGTTNGETAGGYVKNANAKNINFMIIEKSALLQYTKHAVPKIISPEANQDADAYKYGYRNYGLADVYENKVCGIYLHTATK